MEEVVPKREGSAKQHWTTDDIIDLFNERSTMTIPDEYNELDLKNIKERCEVARK